MVRKSRSDTSSSTISRSNGSLLGDYTGPSRLTFQERQEVAEAPLIEIFAGHFVEETLQPGAVAPRDQRGRRDAPLAQGADEGDGGRAADQPLRECQPAGDRLAAVNRRRRRIEEAAPRPVLGPHRLHDRAPAAGALGQKIDGPNRGAPLTESIAPPVALIEADGIPRHVVVDDDSCALQV